MNEGRDGKAGGQQLGYFWIAPSIREDYCQTEATGCRNHHCLYNL